MSLQKLLVKDVNSIVLSLKFKKGKGSERGQSPETLHCKKQMFFDYVNFSLFICLWQFWKEDYFRSGESETLQYTSQPANSKLLAELN